MLGKPKWKGGCSKLLLGPCGVSVEVAHINWISFWGAERMKNTCLLVCSVTHTYDLVDSVLRGGKFNERWHWHLISCLIPYWEMEVTGMCLLLEWWRMGTASKEWKVIRKLRSSFENSVRIQLPFVCVGVLLLQNINTAWLLRIDVRSYRGARSERVIWTVWIRQWSGEICCNIDLSKKGQLKRKGQRKGYNSVFLTLWNCATVE